jgi:hypothetical protein
MLPLATDRFLYSLEGLPDLPISFVRPMGKYIQVVQSRAFVLQAHILQHIAYLGISIYGQLGLICQLTIRSLHIQ